MLQQLGLLDNAELASHLAETERKQDILIGILKDISAEYPQVRNEIMRRLSQISNQVEEVIIAEANNVTSLRDVSEDVV
jgi:vacuolar-type H+-ATPase subunit D/Vma8